jgi:hypothetical protein
MIYELFSEDLWQIYEINDKYKLKKVKINSRMRELTETGKKY